MKLLKIALKSAGATLPKSYYEVKQLKKRLGFSYDKIHASKNDCVIFWKEHADKQKCPICNASRLMFDVDKVKKIQTKYYDIFP